MKRTALILTALALIIFTVFYLIRAGSFGGKAFYKSKSYRLIKNWPQLPDSFKLGSPTGLGIDTSGNLVVFHRAGRKWPLIMPISSEPIPQNTILVLDAESGYVKRSWGSNLFAMPHGLTVDTHNNIWVTDIGLHQVFKFSYNGELLLKLGEAGVSGADKLHFNQPTDVAVAHDGSFYVSDGYGNSRIVKFSASGQYLLAWGRRGNSPTEFDIPHAVDLDKNGNVFVADRENKRIQIFTPDGAFIKELRNPDWGNICSVKVDTGNNEFVAVDDAILFKIMHQGSDIIMFNAKGDETGRFGRGGLYKGPVSWYHDVAVDKDGNLYVADILGDKLQKFKALNSH